ncbi:MAG: DGQHR domain-containing protein [Thermoplasmata archaeon]
MQVEALRYEQHGRPYYLVVRSAEELVEDESIKVATHDPQTESGYQRPLTQARSMDFGRYIKERSYTSPPAILVSLRKEGALKFTPHEKGSHIGILEIPDNLPKWIVDGQHRKAGLDWAHSRGIDLSDLEFPVILMEALEETEEMFQFIVINKTQVGVEPALTNTNIAKLRDYLREHGDYVKSVVGLPRVIERDMSWRPDVTRIVHTLAKTISDNPNDPFYLNAWYNRIKLGGTKKTRDLTFAASQKSMEDSLRPVYDHFRSVSGQVDTDYVAKILALYWRAIGELCPTAMSDTRNYLIQRTTGIFVLHGIFPTVLPLATRDSKAVSVQRIKEVLSAYPEAFRDEYWERETGVGRFGTSQKVFRAIRDEILGRLDEAVAEQEESVKPYEIEV